MDVNQNQRVDDKIIAWVKGDQEEKLVVCQKNRLIEIRKLLWSLGRQFSKLVSGRQPANPEKKCKYKRKEIVNRRTFI